MTSAPVFAIRTATGCYRNARLGLPVSGGMTMVYDAMTGMLRMLIADNGLLTDDELTVADLTGLGIQDAAVAALAVRLAGEHGAGQDVSLGDS